MRPEQRDTASLRFSAGDLPPSQRLSALREIFGQVVHLDLEAQLDQQVDAEMTVHAVPGLRRTTMVSSLTVRMKRSAPMLNDGDDAVCLIIKTAGRLALSQCGSEAEPLVGDGLLLLYREPAFLQFADMTYCAVRVPFAALAALAKDVEAAAAQCIPRDNEALSLLRTYLANLPARMTDPQLSRLAATHVHDLIALVIGATGEGRELARQRGLRAARLEAIKSDLTQDPGLNLDRLAARQGISPRYVQMLFEEAGTTLSAFVLERRLDAARCMLMSPRYIAWTVTAIAMEAGFGDVSYFNRRFKQRYCMTPTDLRARVDGIG